MWIVFFIIAIIWICLLLFYITIETNQLEKSVEKLTAACKKHYGLKSNTPADK